jgi:PAS domain S-box-containing protein
MISGWRWLGGAVLAFAVLLGAGALAYRNTGELVATQRWIAHTHDVLDTVDAAVSIMKDAEIAVRGYLVTADDDLAHRRDVLRPELVERLDHLRLLVADNPEQQRNVDALDAAVRAKLAYSDDVVRHRQERDLGVAELDGRLSEDLRRIDEISGLASLVQRTEQKLLAGREAAAQASTERTLAALVGGTTLGIGLLAAVLLLLRREIGERQRVEHELRVSERRLTLALDAAEMGLWDLDLAHDRSHRTLRHDQIFGYDSLLPRWGREILLTHLHPDDREAERRAFEHALATGDFAMEVRIVRRDGAIRWIACEGKLFRNEQGDPAHLMGSVRDVTGRKEADERLRERSQQLEVANEALGSFTYSVSHDLRAPLRAINGYAHILAEEHGDALDDESRRVLDVICSNARQMGRLIDDLLSFSRLGRTDLERSPIDMTILARSAIDELRRAEPQRRVHVVLHDLPSAVVDATMLRQVFANLIGNAWKFSRDRADATIEIGSFEDGGETIYFVKDNGAGFDMDYASKLFRVFERLHRADEFEGTGVGLAIVQRVVQRHRGRVWAEARVGGGATFYFALPHERGAVHGARERRDSLGGGQPSGRGIGGASTQEA